MTTPTKHVRTKTAVRHYHDGGFLVRGTLDPTEALKIAIEADIDLVLGYTPPLQAGPEEVRTLADFFRRLLASARPGLYRIVPTPHDDDLSWHVWPSKQRGPGAFEGVEFR